MTMTPEQAKHFDELFTTFNSLGWKTFIEEATSQFETLKETSYLTCETNDVWQRQRGIMQTLKTIMNYEDSVRAQYDQLLQEDDDDQTDV